MARYSGVPGISNFDPNQDAMALASEWPEWKQGLDRFLRVKKIVEDEEKIDMMLHCAGTKVQAIYDSLPEPENIEGIGVLTPYQKALRRLDSYFLRKTNVNIERKKFRSMGQNDDENVPGFVMRLRRQAVRCNFEANDTESNIIEQVIAKAKSERLRRKIIEKNCTTVDEVLELSEICEIIGGMTLPVQNVNVVNNLQRGLKRPFSNSTLYQRNDSKRFKDSGMYGPQKCYRCGQIGHLSFHQNCPARNKKCKRCNRIGHFERECRSSRYNSRSEQVQPKDKLVNEIQGQDDRSIKNEESLKENSEYVMTIDGSFRVNKCVVKVKIGGVCAEVLIDSGADVNIMDVATWDNMKIHEIKTLGNRRGSEKILKGIGSRDPLIIIGEFDAFIEAGPNKKRARFYVIKNGGRTILGWKSSMELKLLKVGYDINQV